MNIINKTILLGLGALTLAGCTDYSAHEKIKKLEAKLIAIQMETKSSRIIEDDFNNDGLIDIGFVSYDDQNALEVGFTITNQAPYGDIKFSHKSGEVFRNPQLKSGDINKDGRKDLILLSFDYQGNPQTHYLINGKDYQLNFFKVN